jgi:M3 family oligoendopeptidase
MKLVLSALEIIVPDFEKAKQGIIANTEAFINATTYESAQVLADKHHEMMDDFNDMCQKSVIKFFDDMTNKNSLEDFSHFQAVESAFDQLDKEFDSAMNISKFHSDFANHYGQIYMDLLSEKEKLNVPEAVDLIAKIDKIASSYTELISSASLEMDGEKYNFSGLIPFKSSSDRAVRKKASDVGIDYMYEHRTLIADKFDEMVKLRNKVAQISGFKNAGEYYFLYHGRTGYFQKDIAKYRDNIVKYISPLLSKIREIKKQNLGLETLAYYDNLLFLDGGPLVSGSNEEKMSKAKKMYSEFSPETAMLFNKMYDEGYFQIENKPGKRGGGFATIMKKGKTPLIFTGFTGTGFDFEVLTHEFGHAFQFDHAIKHSKNYKTHYPKLDCVEVFSHTMEFFTYPWVDLFFEKDSAKFLLDHICNNVFLINACCIEDEFQQGVYENENWTDSERNDYYESLNLRYNSKSNIDENPKIKEGIRWKQSGHIVTMPFYNIDYSLAMCIALQIYKIYKTDKDQALKIYNIICENCAGMNIISMIEISGLKSPFEEETVKEIAEFLNAEIDIAFENYKQSI